MQRVSAFYLDADSGHAVGKQDMRAHGLVGLCSPFVADGRAVRVQGERACNFAGSALGRFDVRCAFGEPAAFSWRDLEFFMADGLTGELNGELSSVLDENAARRGFLLGGRRQRGAGS